jgi:hypothetical protein
LPHARPFQQLQKRLQNITFLAGRSIAVQTQGFRGSPLGGIVNCTECQTDPLTPGHYCPCCGRKLSLEEQRAVGATLPASAPVRTRVIVTKPAHEPAPAVAQKVAALDLTQEVLTSAPIGNADEVRMAKAKAVADLTAQAHLAKAANPTPVIRRPIAPIPPAPERRNYTPMLMMAAAVIVGVIGAAEGARRFGFQWPGRDVREAQPVQMAANVEAVAAPAAVAPPPEQRRISRDTPSAPKVVPQTKVARSAGRPKADTAPAQRTSGRPANSTVQNAAPAVARDASPEIPASASAKAPAAESPRSSAPLTGRLFESSDVDEPPRIASRVAPRLPANLPAGADKRIVVARVLVSSSGQPHRVSLLRGSMLGRASDEAVVAAVAKWTFSPAKKRGEAVNCWYNFGIPLAQAD